MPPKIVPEDDDRQQERPQRFPERLAHVGPAERLLDRKVVAAREPVGDAHHAQAAEDAGHDAGDEELDHRGAGDHRVEQHRDRRRDDDRERGRRGDHRGRELLAVAAASHRRDQDRAQRRRVGDRRAGDLGEKERRPDRHHRQPAADPAEQRRRERDQPARDARRVHDRARQDEQRDRDQREAGRAVVHRDRDVGQHRHALRGDQRDDRDDARARSRSECRTGRARAQPRTGRGSASSGSPARRSGDQCRPLGEIARLDGREAARGPDACRACSATRRR